MDVLPVDLQIDRLTAFGIEKVKKKTKSLNWR